MKFVVDRIEGGYALVEVEKGTVDMPLCLLPKDVGEGSVIEIVLVSSHSRETELKERLGNLFNK